MSNIIDKIQLSGTNYDIQDSVLKGEIYISSTNRDSIQTVIKEGVYSLSTDDVYTITGSKAHSTDRVKGQIIVDNSTYNFTGSTSSDVEGVAALNGIVTFDLSSPFSITLVNRDVNKINELFIETFTNEGEESPMDTITITHNPSVGVNKIDYVSTLYTEFVHEKYALVSDLDNKQDTLVNQINIKSVNNQSLLGSGNITIQGGEGSPTVEVTQVQYDALVSAGTVSADTYYIITDATPIDVSQYWTSAQTQSAITQATSGKANSSDVYTKSDTSGATEIATALSGKQDTLSAGTNITIVDNVISATGGGGGGGKAVSGGTNISITTGETADTINCTLPLTVGSGSRSLKNTKFGDSIGEASFAMGKGTVTSKSDSSFAFGANVSVDGYGSFGAGINVNTYNSYATVFGLINNVSGLTEFACGQNCLSRVVDGSFAGYGNSGNTQFVVGNGKQNAGKHNAFEVRQSGDIYIVDTNDTSTSNYWEKPMIRLQDQLGGGGSSYSAGTGIDITNDVISVTGMVATSAVTSAVTSGSTDVLTSGGAYDQLGGLKLVKLTQSAYDALSPNYDSNTLYVIVN